MTSTAITVVQGKEKKIRAARRDILLDKKLSGQGVGGQEDPEGQHIIDGRRQYVSTHQQPDHVEHLRRERIVPFRMRNKLDTVLLDIGFGRVKVIACGIPRGRRRQGTYGKEQYVHGQNGGNQLQYTVAPNGTPGPQEETADIAS